MQRQYIFRILWILPGLFLVSLIAFFLSRSVPGDPVIDYMTVDRAGVRSPDFLEQEKVYRNVSQNLGLDEPQFYFAVHSNTLPDTFHRILQVDQRANFKKWAFHTQNWPLVNSYRTQLYNALHFGPALARHAEFLLIASSESSVEARKSELIELKNSVESGLHQNIDQLTTTMDALLIKSNGIKSYIPNFDWYGAENQYHRWLSGVLKGDFGVSIRDRLPVGAKIFEALKWTLIINIAALILAFAISIWLGVWLAKWSGSKMERWIQSILFAIYAIPIFWLATILVATFTTDSYAGWLDWFPTEGLGGHRDATSIWSKIGIVAYHLVLPVICLVVGSLAYLTRQMSQSMTEQLNMQYASFYKSFGITDRIVIWRHAFRNALFPMVTILGGAIPGLFSGSLIIEIIFNIPGMGRLMFVSILAKDWSVVFAVLLLVAAVTVLAYLLTDILYQYLDPRLRNASKSTVR